MWAWLRERKPRPSAAPASFEIPVRVIGCLSPGYVRVIVGPVIGLLDGGSHHDWPLEWVPAAARRPNAEFRISGIVDGVPQVVEGGPIICVDD